MRKTILSVVVLLVCSSMTLGAAQPIPGVDIIAKRRPGNWGNVSKIGGGGVNVPDNFFYPGFLSSAVFGPGGQDIDGNNGLDRGALLHIQRFTAPNFSAAPPYNIDAQIIQFSLVSAAPLNVGAGQQRDWTLSMSSTAMGQMTLTNDNASGGAIASSFFDVAWQIDFTPVGGGPVQTLNGTDRLFFDATPNWSNAMPGGGPGPDGTNFVLGSDGISMTGAVLKSQSGAFAFEVEPLPEPGCSLVLLLGACVVARRDRRRAG